MRRWLIPALTAFVLGVTMALQSALPDPVLCEPPDRHLGELAGFTSVPIEPGEAERTTLPADTAIEKRLYTDEDGAQYQVTLVIGGRSKSSLHRPELCLPSQGHLMTRPHTVSVDGIDWRVIVLDGGESRPSHGFAYTFFNQAGYRTSSHTRRILRDVWDRSVHGRIDRWAMVTVYATATEDAALSGFLARLREVVR